MSISTNRQSGNGSSRRTWLVTLAAFTAGVFSPGLFASSLSISACGRGTVATYDVPGFQCTVDGYTLQDFTFADSATGGATLLPDSAINVDPSGSNSSGISLQFSGNFIVPAGQTAEYIFQYELDPVLPMISSLTVKTGPGDPVTLTGQFCGNGTLNAFESGQPTSCSGTNPTGIFPATVLVEGNNMSASTQFPVLVTDLDSRLVLDLVGPASITSFGTTVNISPVPEPSTSLWLALGILVVLWLRRGNRLASGG